MRARPSLGSSQYPIFSCIRATYPKVEMLSVFVVSVVAISDRHYPLTTSYMKQDDVPIHPRDLGAVNNRWL